MITKTKFGGKQKMEDSPILDILGIPLKGDAAETPLLTVESTLERLSGDMELLSDLFHLFAGNAAKNVAEVGAFLERADLVQAARAAHALKGSSSTVGAARLQQASVALEQAIRNGEKERLAFLYSELQDICTRTLVAISHYQDGSAAAKS